MGDNDAETFANITRADYDLEDEAFDAISNDAKNFISGLLIKRKEQVFLYLSILEDYLVQSHIYKLLRTYFLAQITYVSHAVLGTPVDDTTCCDYEQNSLADRKTKEIHHTEEVAGVY